MNRSSSHVMATPVVSTRGNAHASRHIVSIQRLARLSGGGDLSYPHSEMLTRSDKRTPGNDMPIDQDIQRFIHESVELEHTAVLHLEQLRHCGLRAANSHCDLHFHRTEKWPRRSQQRLAAE